MMLGAYGWAFVKPIRKLFYNMTITLISVLVAVLVGVIEVLQILGEKLSLTGGIWGLLGNLDFGAVGLGIIGIFVLSWGISTIVYRVNKYDEMEAAGPAGPTA